MKGGWKHIGAHKNPFGSVFDGNRHTIFNLYIDRSSVDKVGFFAITSAAAIIRDVYLVDVHVIGQ